MKERIQFIIAESTGIKNALVEIPEREEFGHYSTNIAMRLGKEFKKPPLEVARELAAKISESAPARFFEKVDAAAPGFINFRISREVILGEFQKIAADMNFCVPRPMQGKTVMVEFTDVNPFKQVHVGHLMSNAIGESIARLYEATGATVLRVNYQSDVGLHVAMALWAMTHILESEMPDETEPLADKMAYLGRAYAAGSRVYRGEDPQYRQAKQEIEDINRKVYDRSDEKVNVLYDTGRRWSLDYFETLYARLGTKFVHYFFESEVAKTGFEIIEAHPEVFEKSDGAVIFRAEKYGLHTRVFVNSKGLPVYEGKELGLNKMKFDLYHPDISVIITGNEIVDYFKVLMKAMEFVIPDVARRTRHIAHGMLRLAGGKMSSRTGDVITAESLIDDVKTRLGQMKEGREEVPAEKRRVAGEFLAIGAIKYSILKQNSGQDIVFDIEKSLALHGDSGLYLQYAHARLMSVLRKAEGQGLSRELGAGDVSHLETKEELALIRKALQFPDTVIDAASSLAPSTLAKYLYEFTALANRFYESVPILKDEDTPRRAARLYLAHTSAGMIRKGLSLLGIQAPERM
jgi:arginyl-tRNA synthetase